MVAVAVLVVIAIAGIVLATLRQRGAPAAETPAAADATPAAASAMTAAAAAAVAAEAEAEPNQVVFAPGSDEVSEAATAKLQRLADASNKAKRPLIITGLVEEGPDSPRRKELARNRAFAVRAVLEANGVPLAKMEARVEEKEFGRVSAKEANRIEVTPR